MPVPGVRAELSTENYLSRTTPDLTAPCEVPRALPPIRHLEETQAYRVSIHPILQPCRPLWTVLVSVNLFLENHVSLPANKNPALPGINGGGVFPSPPRMANPTAR